MLSCLGAARVLGRLGGLGARDRWIPPPSEPDVPEVADVPEVLVPEVLDVPGASVLEEVADAPAVPTPLAPPPRPVAEPWSLPVIWLPASGSAITANAATASQAARRRNQESPAPAPRGRARSLPTGTSRTSRRDRASPASNPR